LHLDVLLLQVLYSHLILDYFFHDWKIGRVKLSNENSENLRSSSKSIAVIEHYCNRRILRSFTRWSKAMVLKGIFPVTHVTDEQPHNLKGSGEFISALLWFSTTKILKSFTRWSNNRKAEGTFSSDKCLQSREPMRQNHKLTNRSSVPSARLTLHFTKLCTNLKKKC
jgi:hypothetical protein